jgi:hypothetical protein
MKPKKMKWTPKKREVTYDLFWFTVKFVNGKYIVEQQPERPDRSSEARDSLLVLTDEDQTFGFSINITWLSGKPAPNTPERNKGLLAVMEHVHSFLDEETREKLKHYFVGIGHVKGGKADFHIEE